MIQVNEERRRENLPTFRYATIMTGIHESASDPYAHATLAVATSSMRASSSHVVVHTRVTSTKTEIAEYIGSEAFVQNVKTDHKPLRDSYHDPVPVRTSLSPMTDTVIPIGHTVAEGVSQWYIVDDETEELVYIELNAFFRAGEGDNEHLQFWNPLKRRICRATFLGNERPQPPSPDPQPSNLDVAISDLTIASPTPVVEWVTLELKLDKETSKPIQSKTESGEKKRTGWEKWEGRSHENRLVYLFMESKTGNQYWAESLPGGWVQPRRKSSSDRPIRFAVSSGEIKTKETNWIAGKGGSFYVYMNHGRAYLAQILPP